MAEKAQEREKLGRSVSAPVPSKAATGSVVKRDNSWLVGLLQEELQPRSWSKLFLPPRLPNWDKYVTWCILIQSYKS
jgi:hypothetical protein